MFNDVTNQASSGGFWPWAAFIYAIVIYSLFRFLDGKASGPAKSAITKWIKSPRRYDNRQVGAALVESFDWAYAAPLFHWRAFVRSWLFSTIVAAAVLYEIGQPPETGLLTYLIVPYACNIVSDYASLFVIRRWLVVANRRPLTALFIGPLVGAISIALIYFVMAAFIVYLWLPLFAIAKVLLTIALHAINLLKTASDFSRWFIKHGNQHPVQAIGYVAAAVVFTVRVIVGH